MLSFNEIYNTYYLRLVYYANKFLNDYQLSEEVVHDELLKLQKHLHKIKDDKSLKSWLYRCIGNTCRNVLDHRRYIGAIVVPPKDFPVSLNEHFETCAEIWAEIVGELYEEIEKLSPQRQLIFKLSYFENKSNEEISIMTGLNMQTVKNSLYQALTILRIKCNVKKEKVTKDAPAPEKRIHKSTLKSLPIRQMINEHRSLTPKEIAAKLGLSLSVVYKYKYNYK